MPIPNPNPVPKAKKPLLFCLGCLVAPFSIFLIIGVLMTATNAIFPGTFPDPTPTPVAIVAPTAGPSAAPTFAVAPTQSAPKEKSLANAPLEKAFPVQAPTKKRRKRRRKAKPTPTPAPTATLEEQFPSSTTDAEIGSVPDSSGADSGTAFTQRPVEPGNGQCSTGATAVCDDGSLSFAANHRGACSHHGGVAQWCD